ncbi:hypothetical protein ES703_46098 [subsurface metagenome]
MALRTKAAASTGRPTSAMTETWWNTRPVTMAEGIILQKRRSQKLRVPIASRTVQASSSTTTPSELVDVQLLSTLSGHSPTSSGRSLIMKYATGAMTTTRRSAQVLQPICQP